jgi:hypothetical protein
MLGALGDGPHIMAGPQTTQDSTVSDAELNATVREYLQGETSKSEMQTVARRYRTQKAQRDSQQDRTQPAQRDARQNTARQTQQDYLPIAVGVAVVLLILWGSQ